MVVSGGASSTWGWMYIGARAFYPILAINGGIGTTGSKNMILLSTIPAYIALIGLAVSIFMYW